MEECGHRCPVLTVGQLGEDREQENWAGLAGWECPRILAEDRA